VFSSRRVERIISSPTRRALDSITPTAALHRVDIQEDAQLAEWEIPWIADTDWPRSFRHVLSGRLPLPSHAEQVASARNRAVAFLHRVMREGSGPAILVTHGKILSLLLGHLRDSDPFEEFLAIGNPHVFEVSGAVPNCEVRTLWSPADPPQTGASRP